MITITEKALLRIKELLGEKIEITFLEVKIESSGCAGLSYKMDFKTTLNSDDQIFEHQDLKVVTNKKSLLYLIGIELDYSDGLNGKGFEWNNPSATRVCGCGESFSI